MEKRWVPLMDKRGEKGSLEYTGGARNRGQNPSAWGGSQRRPQAASGIVEVMGQSEPNIIHKQTFW